ncbi:predicted xylanase/chitin deacetylase [Longilinea arvoryzae]|uniref:Predicted xylanase/chitin deacetylase n=1 Tax=Longilinea arvoryzae TaxID=360412 RepID=A0A0S7BKV8_9CHLR|nr:polysaccharide deacetylase family protein [Longilinea arvoryzae]GAP14497.1 predicted xylanase/chitin deacetylase [Longilinea arvoryzae]
MPKHRWKNALLTAAEAVGAIDLLQKTGREDGQSLYVLAYHRVEAPALNPWLDPADISATPAQFAAQLELLACRYHPVALADVLAAQRGEYSLPRDAVLLTVDDGYSNFMDEIFPVCARFGIRPLLFLATGCVGSGTYWWDQVYQLIHHSGQPALDTPAGRFPIGSPEEKARARRELLFALKRMPGDQRVDWIGAAYDRFVRPSANPPRLTLSWDELRALRQAGVDIAPHTHSHPILSQIPLESVRAELRTSRNLIEHELGECPPVFALPDGKAISYHQGVIDLLFSSGCAIVFSMLDGRARVRPNSAHLLLPRLGVWQGLSLPHFHYRLTPRIDRPTR